MTVDYRELRRRLRAEDPLSGDPGLSLADAARMRRAAIAAADAPPAPRPRAGTLALVTAFAVAVTFGVVAAHKAGSPPDAGGPRHVEADPARVTQVHFSTPGGTRIIWTIDPAFHLEEGPR